MNKYLYLLFYLVPATVMIWLGLYQEGNPRWMSLVLIIGTMVMWGILAKEFEDYTLDATKTHVSWFVASNLCAALTLGLQFAIIRLGLNAEASFGFVAIPLCYLCFGIALMILGVMIRYFTYASLWLSALEFGLATLFGSLATFLLVVHIYPLLGYPVAETVSQVCNYTIVGGVVLAFISLEGYLSTAKKNENQVPDESD